MPINISGLTTGLLGYSLKKDFLGDTFYYRETQVFNYEIYSVWITGSGYSPNSIQQHIFNQFSSQYSGNINVKVFQVPADYTFPNDSIRAAKFNVQVEVRDVPSNISGLQTEMSGAYYDGLDFNFFNTYGSGLVDFREDFSFEQAENGNQIFDHNLSFGLISGDRNTATQLAGYIFNQDSNTTFGITAMVGGAVIANTGSYQNYFTETYDTIKNTYSFAKRREILPLTDIPYVYDLQQVLDLKEDGVFDIQEKGKIKGKLNFGQAELGVVNLLSGAYTRCNLFYNTYAGYAGDGSISYPLVNFPIKTTRTYNKPAYTAEYDITFTNNPLYQNNNTVVEEVMELDVDVRDIVSIKHRFNFEINRRNPPANGFMDLINNAVNATTSTANNYYLNSDFYSPSWPLQQVKQEINWPNKRPKTFANFEYTNHPRNFVTINGVVFNKLEYKIDIKKPEDIYTEFKSVNRPNHLSILNYAYQTEKGEVSINFNANIGRNPNEFVQGFRTNLGSYLYPLFKYGVSLFMKELSIVDPIAFTYLLSDAKYRIDSDGMLDFTVTFTYTVKRYIY